MYTRFAIMVLIMSNFLFNLTNAAAAESNIHTTAARAVNIQHWQTARGVPVYFVRAPEIPMMDVQLVFRAGSAYDGTQYGLANLTNGLFGEGAAGLTADQISEKFDAVAAIFSNTVSTDLAAVGLRSLTDPNYLKPALQTFATVISAPDFSTIPFERVKKQALVALQAELQSPTAVAKKVFLKALYGDQPYGHSPSGTMESVAKLTQQDAQNFYQRFYVAKNAIVAIVGDLSVEQAHEIAEQVTQALVKGSTPEPLAMAQAPTQPVMKQIHFPSEQTTVVLGELGVTPLDVDVYSLTVGNFILGGAGLVSRLFTQIRNQRGLVYNIASQFAMLQAKGPFAVVFQTRNQQARNAWDVTRTALVDFINQGPTDQEVAKAKQHIIGEFPLTIDSNADILGRIAFIGFYGLPLDYLDTYRDKINAITAEQIRAAFQKHLNPKALVTVTVGQYIVSPENTLAQQKSQ